MNKNYIIIYIHTLKKRRVSRHENNKIRITNFFSKNVTSRALKVAIIVGIILAFINHGDLIFSGKVTTECWIKMIVTCFVPYTVSSITATLNILESRK